VHHICVDILRVPVQVNPRPRPVRHNYGMPHLHTTARQQVSISVLKPNQSGGWKPQCVVNVIGIIAPGMGHGQQHRDRWRIGAPTCEPICIPCRHARPHLTPNDYWQIIGKMVQKNLFSAIIQFVQGDAHIVSGFLRTGDVPHFNR
jgi:hypothetical protein